MPEKAIIAFDGVRFSFGLYVIFLGNTQFKGSASNQPLQEKVKTLKIKLADPLNAGDTLEDLARECNPIIRGWINYYGRFNPSAMFGILDHINWRLVRSEHQLLSDSLIFLFIGVYCIKKAERWEPYELRGSRTVLREPEGEVPLGYSPESLRGKYFGLLDFAKQKSVPLFTSSDVGVMPK